MKTIEVQAEMIKHLAKHNAGSHKNRIHFTSIQFPYNFLGTDLEEAGEETGKQTWYNHSVGLDPTVGFSPNPLPY